MKPRPLNESELCDAQSQFLGRLRPGQLMEGLFDAIPGVFYFVKDLDSRFMGGSIGFAQSMGVTFVEELIGKTDYDFSPDFLADAFYADDQSVMASAEEIQDKVELVPAADGSLDWLSTTKMPLYGNNGSVIGLAGVARIIRDDDAVYADHPEMHRIVNHVRVHYRAKMSVADMANIGGISVSSQERLFRKIFGLTPLMYLRKTRLNAACAMLRDTGTDLAQIAVECGLTDQTNMTRAFRLELKITPLKYRRRFRETKPKRKESNKTVLFTNT
ncbi:MAG: helix-turn-helix domain-containing protein [Lentimonas sp.]